MDETWQEDNGTDEPVWIDEAWLDTIVVMGITWCVVRKILYLCGLCCLVNPWSYVTILPQCVVSYFA